MIRRKKLDMNFKGIGIGGGWVNPKESISVQPQYLYHTVGIVSISEYYRY